MESLTSKIEKVVSKLNKVNINDPIQPNFTPFREFEKFCNQLVFEAKDDFERFSAFFFGRYFANFFDNLGGDAFYDDELKIVKIKIYIHLEESLTRIKDNLEKKNNEVVIKLFCEIVEVYAKEINYLNRQF